MSVLTNKHVIIAMLVAPVLAVITYLAVDYKVSEKPHAAVQGSAYALVAKSNCRYASGRCTFINGDINIEIRTQHEANGFVNYSLKTDLPLDGLKLGFTQAGDPLLFPQVIPIDESLTQWQLGFDASKAQDSSLQLVVKIDDVLYYGETTTIFSRGEAGFKQTLN